MMHAPIDPTRAIAFDLVAAVLDRHGTLDAALDRVRVAAEPRDRAAAHRIAATVLRHLGSLDAMIEAHVQRAPPTPVQHILRIGAAQSLYLGTGAHAAVATAVDLARSRGLTKFAGLVNAVLRRVSEAGPAGLDALDAPRLDTPAWLWASWGARARDIALGHRTEAPLDLSLKPGTSAPDGAIMLPTGTARLPAGSDVTALDGFRAGTFWVQDAAAALPVRLLGDVTGQRVLDMCAAPGGKTMQLAAQGAHVTALDRDAQRMRRLAENMQRLGLIGELKIADALSVTLDPYPMILLDAPCSATGTIRRHPEILHLRRPADVASCAALQDRLIDAAMARLAPGGTLVYAVCSLQEEEGFARVKAAMQRHRLVIDPIRPDQVPGLADAVTREGLLRTDPGFWLDQGGMDGFFAARLRRG
ncbi:MAG: RsmB/NOP family class I SAM-dependent RNA methyltransferase [Acidiphilium sp.]